MASDANDPAVERHMIACVHESLSLYLLGNARFMCERLVAEFPSEVCPLLIKAMSQCFAMHPTHAGHHAYTRLLGLQVMLVPSNPDQAIRY